MATWLRTKCVAIGTGYERVVSGDHVQRHVVRCLRQRSHDEAVIADILVVAEHVVHSVENATVVCMAGFVAKQLLRNSVWFGL